MQEGAQVAGRLRRTALGASAKLLLLGGALLLVGEAASALNQHLSERCSQLSVADHRVAWFKP